MKLFTPGPIAMDPETIAIGGKQSQYFRTPVFSSVMLDCMNMLQTVLDAPSDSRMIFLTASGTAAMEASVMNLFTPQDKLLVIAGGTFGKRFKQICTIHRIPFASIDLAWNETFKPEMLTPFENAGITGMLVNMCETSTGQLYPMDIISDFCNRNNICLVVDAISSFLCDPFSMKTYGASAVIISSQKGLALQPGMSFVAVTKDAFEERCVKNNPQTLYFKFTDYETDIVRGQTPYTPAVSIINQLHEKLQRLIQEGITLQLQYMTDLAVYFRKNLITTSFTIPSIPLSNCLTPVFCPQHNAQETVDFLKKKHDIYVTPCAGELAPFLFRVAHMSRQIT
ncbi:MAG: aminotransferase class V-fold PLP-dependent enzyme, partial [Bacteroidales bacterium]|nr:aminotransferase class V-fold PLP-dependent enzyme [Bacteroidales bacterium]